jgi:fibronectin-binding autotransporter adhesin
LAAILVAWSTPSWAQSFRYWGLRGTGDWTEASNWQVGPPAADFSVIIMNSGTVQVTTDLGVTYDSVTAGIVTSEQGHLQITGDGRLDLSRGFTAGYGNAGSLLISGGGQLTSRSGAIGMGYSDTGVVGNGTATVTGAGSRWDLSSTHFSGFELEVGARSLTGQGTLTISDQGVVTAENIRVGWARGTGTVNITGAGSRLEASMTVIAGAFEGTGTFNVTAGGVMEIDALELGTETNSTGTVIISGTDSLLTTTTHLIIGKSGTGTVTVSDAAHATVGGDTSIGSLTGGSGSLVVTGTGSLVELSGNLDLGNAGSGTLTVANNATARITGALKLATTNGGNATINLNSGGILELANGATDGDGTAVINANGGTLRLTGAHLTTSAAVAFGTGTTSVVDTGEYNATLSGLTSGAGGLTKTGSGTLTLIGNNSFSGVPGYTGHTTIAEGALQIGDGGTTGFLSSATITNDSQLIFNRSDLTNYAGAVSGSGSLTQAGTGRLILNGNNTYTGVTTISAGSLEIGFNTSGSITSASIVNNAHLAFTRTDSTTYAGIISGTGSVAKSHSGTLTLEGHNTYTGATTVYSGTLAINGSLANTAITVHNGAALAGTGTIAGPTTLTSGAALAPGNSPGTLTFTGGLAFGSGAIINFELGTLSDLIVVSGGTLSGPASGTITLNLTDSGGFAAGTYTLIDATGATLSSIGATTFDLGTTIAGYTYVITQSDNTFLLTATAIPEPATIAALLGLAALTLASTRRRRR